MAAVYYTSVKGDYHTVPCISQDIDKDTEAAIDALLAIDEEILNIDAYKEKMELAIEQGKAFAVYRGDTRVAFCYSIEMNEYPNKLVVASFYAKGDIVAMLLILLNIESRKYKGIVFFPHGDSYKFFKSLFSGNQLRKYMSTDIPYMILKKDKKWSRLMLSLVKLLRISKVK